MSKGIALQVLNSSRVKLEQKERKEGKKKKSAITT